MNKKCTSLFLILCLLFSLTTPVGALQKEERLWQDETIYYIMIDRFFNGDSNNNYKVDVCDLQAYNGGDFQGIIDKLDYIKEMGFTTIALSSIFDNNQESFQGDRVVDFYETEKHFGTIEEFQQLVKEAHKKDMHIIIEFVANEVSANHPWATEEDKQDWYVNKGSVLAINHNNAAVEQYLIEAATWWIEETGIDGYYVNHIQGASSQFWRSFTSEVKKVKEDFFTIGMVSEGSLTLYKEAGFDSLMNTSSMPAIREAFFRNDGNVKEAVRVTEEQLSSYKEPALLGSLVDHPQSTRFTYEIDANKNNPGTRWKLALSYLYTVPGIPVVLYGSEIAQNGGEFPENLPLLGFKADQELIDFMKVLGGLRQELPALTRGDFDILYEDTSVVVFKRSYESETIVVAINNSSETQYVTLNEDVLASNSELRGLLAGDLVREKDGQYQMVIDREHAEIYALTDKTSINFGYIAIITSVWLLFAVFIILVMKRSKRKQS